MAVVLVLPRARAGHLALCRRLPPAATGSAAQVQHPAGASPMAGDRQPEPDRRPPAPLHPRPLPAVRPAHVPPVRLLPRRRGLVGGHGQVLPEGQRPGVPGPAEDGRRQVHRVQLRRRAVVALRRVLAPGPPAVGHGAPQRAEAGVDGARPRRGGALHAARPAPPRGRRHRRGAQGAHAHGDAQRHLAHGVREEVHRRGGGGFVANDGGGVQPVIQNTGWFRWMIEEIFFLNGVFNIGDMVPWLGWLDPQGYIGRMKRLGSMFDRFLEHILDEHVERRRREGDGFAARDMVDLLLQFADDPSLKVPIQRDGVKAFILELITGSTDTTSVSVEWAMSEVLRNPSVLAKATDELDRVVGRRRLVAEDDIPNLPYLDAVVKESMRLHPVVPLLVPRVSREDAYSVSGAGDGGAAASYDIPAGTRVLVNVWAIGRDPAVWGDAAEEFRPERFAGGEHGGVDVKGQDFELLPFGSGRRMCPGMGLGLRMVQLTLANLLHGFAWRLPGGVAAAEELSMEEKFGISVSRLVQLKAIPEPKLPAHLYDE
ncbi:dimethylnonatriene synthase-like isoform X2 [Oryza glaberrima]|uniref:dimethylnonatriene synthase-like isoform X2 n=1 Tax=Oryza glaberrima TaxID=4538 RepID=UPI00224C3D32|nr:dimethylnonatriene synthase-like isoform X2 [Oryza glaberrima]